MTLNLTVTKQEIDAVAALSKEEIDDLIYQIKTTDPRPFFERVEGNENQIVCPICGSGSHGNKNTGVEVNSVNGAWCFHCFAGEDFNGDLIKVVANENNLSTKGKDFFEVLAICAKFLGISILGSNKNKPVKNPLPPKNPLPKQLKEFNSTLTIKNPAKPFERLEESRNNLPSFIEKQGGAWRGLSVELMHCLKWGTLPDVYFTDVKKKLPAVIIPNDKGGIFARAVNDKSYRNNTPTATTTIFLPDSDSFDVIITEGAINGASILAAISAPKFGIIASGGTSGNKNVLERLQELKASGKNFRVLIAYDNDSNQSGQKAAVNLLKMLIDARFTACTVDITKKADVDLNDVLRGDNGTVILADMVKSAIAIAQEKLEKSAMEISCRADHTQEENFSADSADYFEEVEKQIAADEEEFEKEKAANIEKITSLETFGNETILQPEILKAAAFCKLYAPLDFSRLKNDIRDFGDKHKAQSVNLTDFNGEVKDYIAEISKQDNDLKHRRAVLNAEKKTAKFVATDDFLSKLNIPTPFAIDKNGVYKVSFGQEAQICRAPIVIRRKIISIEDNTFKFVPAYYEGGECCEIPAVTASTISDKRNITTLSNFGFPVTSNNSANLVEFLDALKFANQKVIPVTYSVSRCGWRQFNGKECFIDRRITFNLANDTFDISKIEVDENNFMARQLKTSGNLEEWQKAFDAAYKSPLAIFMTYLAVAPFLLKILGERNFVVYFHGKTRSGKTTALKLATSAVGSEKLMITFDATPKVIPELAANYFDYVLPIDEKQVADAKAKTNFTNVIYALSGEITRLKLDKNSNIRLPKDLRNITLATGETRLYLEGGANSRLLQFQVPNELIDADTCKFIRETIKENYGLPFVHILNIAFSKGNEYLREYFNKIIEHFEKISNGKILPEYCRYIAVGTLGGFLLHWILEGDEEKAFKKSVATAYEVFKFVPTNEEISDTVRYKNFVTSFIARNSAHFKGSDDENPNLEKFGRIDHEKGYLYIIDTTFDDACRKSNVGDPEKIATDLIADGFFVPADTIEKGRSKPRPKVKPRIDPKFSTWCYRIKLETLTNEE